MKTKILFLCMSNIDRSPCAEEIINEGFSHNLEAKSAGVGPFAEIKVSKESIIWADKIVCMERVHRDMLFEQFPEARDKDVEVWNISSDYCRNDPELEKELRERIEVLFSQEQ